MLQALLIFLLIVVCIFMILLILIQRGKGGGLAGAFGGMGGQSAFGTKAGDTFTKITIWTAVIWFCLCIITITALKWKPKRYDFDSERISAPSTSGPKETASPTASPSASSTPAPAATPAPATTAPAEEKK